MFKDLLNDRLTVLRFGTLSFDLALRLTASVERNDLFVEPVETLLILLHQLRLELAVAIAARRSRSARVCLSEFSGWCRCVNCQNCSRRDRAFRNLSDASARRPRDAGRAVWSAAAISRYRLTNLPASHNPSIIDLKLHC